MTSYDSWGKLGTISVTSRTGIISAIYKKGDKRNVENYRPILFLNLYYKIYTKILKCYLRYKTVFFFFVFFFAIKEPLMCN